MAYTEEDEEEKKSTFTSCFFSPQSGLVSERRYTDNACKQINYEKDGKWSKYDEVRQNQIQVLKYVVSRGCPGYAESRCCQRERERVRLS